MLVQLTTFGCGGLSVSIKLAHILANAQILIGFAHNWAAISCALIIGDKLPSLNVVFDPSRLDKVASGNIDALYPDPTLMTIARNLPLHRYDLWTSSDNCPSFMVEATKIPSELNTNTIITINRLPWSEWDLPCAYLIIL
jgi:hypothetical protein